MGGQGQLETTPTDRPKTRKPPIKENLRAGEVAQSGEEPAAEPELSTKTRMVEARIES